MLCGFAAANAGIAEALLGKGDATRLHAAGNILKLLLAGRFAAPHRLDVARFVLGNIEEFFLRACLVGAVGAVFERAVIQFFMHLLERLFDLFDEVIERDEGLFACDAADQHAGIVFDVARTPFF